MGIDSMSIGSDSDLLTALGFSKSEAGARLGRTRQAIDAGLSGNRRDYFKPHEIAVLLLMARRRGRPIELEAITQYLAQSRASLELSDFEDLLQAGSADSMLLSEPWEDLWIIIPDYRRLRRDAKDSLPTPFATLMALPAKFPDARITYVCAASFERDLLRSDLEAGVGSAADAVNIVDAIPAAAQMTMIVANAWSGPKTFVPTTDGFVRVEYFEGDHLVQNLLKLFPDCFPPQRRDRAVVGRV